MVEERNRTCFDLKANGHQVNPRQLRLHVVAWKPDGLGAFFPAT